MKFHNNVTNVFSDTSPFLHEQFPNVIIITRVTDIKVYLQNLQPTFNQIYNQNHSEPRLIHIFSQRNQGL